MAMHKDSCLETEKYVARSFYYKCNGFFKYIADVSYKFIFCTLN